MQDSTEKLSIAEFADRAGCTKQRIYQLLNNRLKPFTITENGRKYILSSGIETVLQARDAQGYRNSLTTKCETVEQENETVSSPDFQAEIDELTAELDRCRAESEAKTGELDTIRAEAAKNAADLETVRAELLRTQSDLAAAREQREKAEIRAAAADAERKRADAAERECTVKDNQMKKMQEQAETDKQDLRKQLNALNALLQQEKEQSAAALKREQEHAAELTQALAASQALHAGQIRLAMQDGEPENAEPAPPADQSKAQPEPDAKPGFLARLFHRRKEKE